MNLSSLNTNNSNLVSYNYLFAPGYAMPYGYAVESINNISTIAAKCLLDIIFCLIPGCLTALPSLADNNHAVLSLEIHIVSVCIKILCNNGHVLG